MCHFFRGFLEVILCPSQFESKIAVGDDGEYISDCYNFTDFCIKLTRGSTADSNSE